ncbi:hypothetical protein A6E15_17055 [Natrinema saccharevitans]|uniref:Uncharacterized protein n=1 Tax=Natrinema saccharevitans TaxID=301967 RepID=A0A1S8B1Q9_9EURY|nr:hypothetical protein [Natrinema saccharevitans]OLZ42564.1 hypothetical protein A6E15_17055 [Natrinema saccharevitans]
MRGDSLLGGVRRVDEQGSRLLSLRTFSGPEPARRVEIAMDALLDLAELLRAGAPFPPRLEPDAAARTADARPDGGSRVGGTNGDEDCEDALVRRVLAAGYERGATTVEGFDDATADRIAAANRLETVDSRVIVPLSRTAPHAFNWRPVIEALLDRLEGVRSAFGRVRDRVRAAGIDRPFAAGCEAIVAMLESLSLVVERADAGGRYVRDRTDQRQGELLSTIADATTQLRGDENA